MFVFSTNLCSSLLSVLLLLISKYVCLKWKIKKIIKDLNFTIILSYLKLTSFSDLISAVGNFWAQQLIQSHRTNSLQSSLKTQHTASDSYKLFSKRDPLPKNTHIYINKLLSSAYFFFFFAYLNRSLNSKQRKRIVKNVQLHVLSHNFELSRNWPELSNYLVNTLSHLYVYDTLPLLKSGRCFNIRCKHVTDLLFLHADTNNAIQCSIFSFPHRSYVGSSNVFLYSWVQRVLNDLVVFVFKF